MQLARRERHAARQPVVRAAALAVALAGCDLIPSADAGHEPARSSAAALGSAALGAPKARAHSRTEAQPVPAASPASTPDRAATASAQNGCPPETARIEDVCVDRYEAHLALPGPGGALALHPPHERPAEGVRYVARSSAGVLPQAYISRVEAEDACENAGKRLCSLLEWYRACRGAQDTTYPYGRRYERKRCNVGKPHLLSRLFGTNPLAWQYDAHFNDPKLAQLPGFLAKTGEYAGCVSDYGVADMVGNLHEWVADRADGTLAQKLPLKDGIRRALGRNSGKGVFMGGFFSTTSEHGTGCSFITAAHEPRYHDYSTGFRCCRDASR